MELSDFESLNTKRKLSFQIDHRTVRVPNRECCTVNRTEEKYRGASCTTVNRFHPYCKHIYDTEWWKKSYVT